MQKNPKSPPKCQTIKSEAISSELSRSLNIPLKKLDIRKKGTEYDKYIMSTLGLGYCLTNAATLSFFSN